jgi:beta-lactamase class A
METLRQKIETVLAPYAKRWGIVIVNQATGDRLEINPEMVFSAASLIKVPIMYELMRQVADGRITLDDCLMVTKEFRTGGAGILKELRPDLTMTVRDLVVLMIILSDNTATNMLMDLVGIEAINRTMTGLGLKSTVLRRRMMDFDAAQAGYENDTSAADLALLFADIHNSVGLPQTYGALMLNILARQQVQDKLPFYLPEGTVMAHKTGTLPGVEHDAGILFLPHASYIICILTDGLAANYLGIQCIATLGKVIYEHISSALSSVAKGE